MRCASVSSLKLTLKGKKRKPLSPTPRAGSKLSKFYNLLQANKGKPVPIVGLGDRARIAMLKRQLEDFYGLDIHLHRGTRKHGNKTLEYILVGEWFGRVYVDYLANKQEE